MEGGRWGHGSGAGKQVGPWGRRGRVSGGAKCSGATNAEAVDKPSMCVENWPVLTPLSNASTLTTIRDPSCRRPSPTTTTERRVPELIPVLGSQPAGDVSHKPGGRLPLLSARPAVTPATPQEGCYQFCCLVNRGTMGVNSLPKTVTRQRRGCDLNSGPSVPESEPSTLTTRLPRLSGVDIKVYRI